MARRKTPSKRRLKARFRIGRPCAIVDLTNHLVWESLKKFQMRVDYGTFHVIRMIKADRRSRASFTKPQKTAGG